MGGCDTDSFVVDHLNLCCSRRWGIIEEGQPPKQIIEDGEYFVLKRVEGGGGHH